MTITPWLHNQPTSTRS